MTRATSGPTSPTRLGTYDPDSCSWRTSVGMYDEDSTVSSQTWPLWGTTRAGALYELPTPALPTVESASSSLLKTPTAQLGVNGGSQHPDKRKAGGHGPTLADEVEHLLPTPVVNDMGAEKTLDWWEEWLAKMKAAHGNGNGHGKSLAIEALKLLPTPKATDGYKGGPNMRGSSGDLMLPSAVVQLLPTPTVGDSRNTRNATAGRSDPDSKHHSGQTLSDVFWTGASTDQPSSDGSACSTVQHPGQLSLGDVEEQSA